MMGSIYTFWYSLSSSSSILEKGFWFIYHLQMTSSEEFQRHFSIISKFVCCGFYIQKNTAFTLISFAVLKSDECLSVQLPFELPIHIPVQLLLDLNVNELEFELPYARHHKLRLVYFLPHFQRSFLYFYGIFFRKFKSGL